MPDPCYRFLPTDDGQKNWADRVADKYQESLFREFAICDLKHYRSGFALRWRTEDEVLAGTGQDTCGNSRCKYHDGSRAQPALKTLELPFAYVERGEACSALVKVVLCDSCCHKLMWKRNQEKAAAARESTSGSGLRVTDQDEAQRQQRDDSGANSARERRRSQSPRRRDREHGRSRKDHRRRSASPKRRRQDDDSGSDSDNKNKRRHRR